MQGFIPQFWEKAPGQNREKMIDLTSKFGEINNIEHNRNSKIYPQNQVVLDCIIPSIPLKHKCLSIILIWVIVGVVSKFFYLFLLFLTTVMVLGKMRLFSIGNRAEIRHLEKGRKSPLLHVFFQK